MSECPQDYLFIIRILKERTIEITKKIANSVIERAGFVVPSDLNPAAEAEGDKDKALKNDEVFGCARSVHSRDLKNIILNITHLTTIV